MCYRSVLVAKQRKLIILIIRCLHPSVDYKVVGEEEREREREKEREMHSCVQSIDL